MTKEGPKETSSQASNPMKKKALQGIVFLLVGIPGFLFFLVGLVFFVLPDMAQKGNELRSMGIGLVCMLIGSVGILIGVRKLQEWMYITVFLSIPLFFALVFTIEDTFRLGGGIQSIL